jgi:ribosomal protein L21E
MTTTTGALVLEIELGLHDSELANLEKALTERLRVTRQSRTIKDYGVGDKVIFNSLCGTQYLQGATGVVVGLKQKKLLVKLDNPVGRFVRYSSDGKVESSSISVPTSIVDIVR